MSADLTPSIVGVTLGLSGLCGALLRNRAQNRAFFTSVLDDRAAVMVGIVIGGFGIVVAIREGSYIGIPSALLTGAIAAAALARTRARRLIRRRRTTE